MAVKKESQSEEKTEARKKASKPKAKTAVKKKTIAKIFITRIVTID